MHANIDEKEIRQKKLKKIKIRKLIKKIKKTGSVISSVRVVWIVKQFCNVPVEFIIY